MLYHLFEPLFDEYIIFNLFRYITFRAAAAMGTALFLSLVLGPPVIRWLRKLRVGQVVRQEGLQSHLSKAGTPTMGGALIILSTVISTLLWAQLTNAFVVITMIVLVGLFILFYPLSPVPATWTSLPFLAEWHLYFAPLLFVPWVMFVLAGGSNAVNLTDGLDGLAGGLSAIAAGTFGIFAYLIGRADTSRYLGLFYMPGSGELTIFCLALAGACLGFLWFNAHPAEVFMGDTGSLALGGALASVAILLKAEFLLVIIGGVFVIEAVSVMAQVSWFKYTARRHGRGQRLLLMSPLHHHFEKAGWAESKIIVRFWILGLLCSLIAFSTLKIR
jgi:phospho-N-acetylmuramoyl-pentapeptide-transferase